MKAPFIVLMMLFVVTAAFAESPKKTFRKAKAKVDSKIEAEKASAEKKEETLKAEAPKQAASRVPASSTTDISATTSAPTCERDLKGSIGLQAGYAVASTSDATAQTAREATNFNRDGYGGVTVDARYKTYGGLELDGFYATGKSGDSAMVDKISGTITNGTRKMDQMGFMAAAKAQYPIALSRWTIWPKAGLGYGVLTLKDKMTATGSATELDSKESVKGAVFLVGVDTEVFENVLFGADFAMSLGGSGTTASATAANPSPADVDTDSASFYRFRVGAYYRITPSFTAGAQYNHRQLKYTVASAETSESINQYLGVVSVNF